MESTLFGTNVSPACVYCEHSKQSGDTALLCAQTQQTVTEYHRCTQFTYAPLKRVPRAAPPLPEFSPEDFKL